MWDAAARWPADLDLKNATGVTLRVVGAFDDAISTFAQGMTIAPTDPVTNFNFAPTSEIRYVRSVRSGQLPCSAGAKRRAPTPSDLRLSRRKPPSLTGDS